MHSLTGE